MPILLLARHATNDFVKAGRLPGQHPNIHLNEDGRTQAESLGMALAGQSIAAVYSSQLERAMETAWRVAVRHGLTVNIRPGLADINAGELTGMVVNDIGKDDRYKDAWKVIVEKPSEGRLPGGEALLEMQERVVACLASIVKAHADAEEPKIQETTSVVPFVSSHQTDGKSDPTKPVEASPKQIVVVVMHADPIKAALAHYLGMPFDNFQRLGAAPASYSAVVVDNDNQARMIQHINRVPY